VLFAEFLKRLFRRDPFATRHRGESFLDAHHRFRPINQLDHSLIGLSVLHDDLGFAVDGQYDRSARLLQLADQRHGIPLETRQRLNIAADVQQFKTLRGYIALYLHLI